MAARVLLFGIWTDADDNGVFEWKPLSLKMRIFPADNIEVVDLLNELAAANVIKEFESGGRKWGAVRNFGKYQKPKKPHYKHELPNELRTYVASRQASSEPVENQWGNQRAVGVGVGVGEKKESKEEPSLRSPGDDVSRETKSRGTRYAFESGIIRLSEKDFEQWRLAYAHLDLRAELLGLTQWAETQGKGWFFAVSGALSKRNRNQKIKIEAAKAGGSGSTRHTLADPMAGII